MGAVTYFVRMVAKEGKAEEVHARVSAAMGVCVRHHDAVKSVAGQEICTRIQVGIESKS